MLPCNDADVTTFVDDDDEDEDTEVADEDEDDEDDEDDEVGLEASEWVNVGSVASSLA
jgi:hypothetical protein